MVGRKGITCKMPLHFVYSNTQAGVLVLSCVSSNRVRAADGTHPLAPILVWFGLNDRIVRVSCSDSGSSYSDELGRPYASDGAVMMAKTEKGRLIKIRLDLVSARPGGSRHVLRTIHCSDLHRKNMHQNL